MLTDCEIIENSVLKNDYRRIRFDAPELCAPARPGQFVHIRIPDLAERILRRPFSICGYDKGILTVVYKIVGIGTARLAGAKPGTRCSVMGPLGTPFPMPRDGETPVIVAGGFGAAATLPIALHSQGRGVLLLGARSSADILLTEEYSAAGFDVRLATQDGSAGITGLVTELLPETLAGIPGKSVIYACGPNGMLEAVGKIGLEKNVDTWLSLDHRMCCGVGACFACVVKVRSAESPDGWRYSRTCAEGPVYNAKEIYYA